MDWTAGEHERSRLAARYREESDQGLLLLDADRAKLTPIAQEALATEMERRDLSATPAADKPGLQTDVDLGPAPPVEVLHTFFDASEASAACAALEHEGIPFLLEDRSFFEQGRSLRRRLALPISVSLSSRAAAIVVLRRERGLFPQAIVSTTEEDVSSPDEVMVIVADMPSLKEAEEAAALLRRADISCRMVAREEEDWRGVSVEVLQRDMDRAFEAISSLISDEDDKEELGGSASGISSKDGDERPYGVETGGSDWGGAERVSGGLCAGARRDTRRSA